MNWVRGRAYAQDLRDKMFAAIDRGISPGAVSVAFAASVSWVYKTVRYARLKQHAITALLATQARAVSWHVGRA